MIHALVGQTGVPTPAAIEQEVLDNVKHQRLGEGTVEDLAMPEEFLQRIADRIVRSSYEERYRIVLQDAATNPSAAISTRGSAAVVVSAVAVLLAAILALVIARRARA